MAAAHHELAKAARVPVGRIRVHPRNIRSKLTRIESLARSVKAEGVLQPLVVHQKFRRGAGVQDLELIAGHRRLAAAEIAGLSTVPCIVLPQMSDDEAILAMLAENTQRRAVPAVDLARAVQSLRGEFHYSEVAIAERLGVTVEQVAAMASATSSAADGDAEGVDDPVASGPVATPRLQPPPARRAAPPVYRKTVTPPKVTPRRIYDLLAEHDAGNVDGDQLAERLRGMLGGWEPAPPRAYAPTSEKEPDWAEVEQLLDGSRRPADSHPSALRAAVQKLDDGQATVATIAVRLGISQRHVLRYRRAAS